jgi:two-component system cell cycle sensor histidine kinase/response regulator CckA
MQCKFALDQQQAAQLHMCAALDALEDHIAVIDAGGVIIFANAAWRRFGSSNGADSPDAYVGQNYLAVCDAAAGKDAEPARAVAAGLRSLLAGCRTALSLDYLCPTPSKPMWFRLRASAFQMRGERYAILSHRDITPRVQAEEARRTSEERHRLIWEATNDAMALTDAGGTVVDANPAYLRLYRRAPQEVIGASFTSVYPPEQRLDVAERYRETFWTQPTGMLFESSVPRADGDERVVEARIDFVERDGLRNGMLSVIRDITAHKRAEARLREQEALFRLIFEQSPLGMALVGLDFTFLRVNDALCRITGYSADELLARGFPAITHPDDLDADLAQARRLAAGEIGQYTLEKRYLHKDGREIWVRLNGGVLHDEDGKVRFYLAQVEEITAEREAAEERLRVEQKLQETQQLESLGLLAGGIAHDFNNLLTVILGNTQAAIGDLPPDSPVRAVLLQVEQASQRAADLTRQILAYAGRGRFLVEPLDLNLLIGELDPLLQASIARGVDLGFAFAPELPAVEGDPTQLRQVLMNLVINASEAIGEGGGVIAVATRVLPPVEVTRAGFELPDELSAGGYVLLEVADTGMGMDQATLRRIFEPFFTTKFTGRGLGLAAVQGIVRRHGGQLSVRSEPGRGSTFSVLLPALACKAPPRVVAERAPLFSWRGMALVIEDEPGVRSLLARLLGRAGFEVLAAPDGLTGVDLFRTYAPLLSCVFLDLTMLGMNGEETFHELKRISPDVPVIVTSGYAEEEVAKRFAGAGLAGFLPKPFTPASVEALLRAVLPVSP